MLSRLSAQGLKRIPGLAPNRFRQNLGIFDVFPGAPLP
jgi:hypothetical protein